MLLSLLLSAARADIGKIALLDSPDDIGEERSALILYAEAGSRHGERLLCRGGHPAQVAFGLLRSVVEDLRARGVRPYHVGRVHEILLGLVGLAGEEHFAVAGHDPAVVLAVGGTVDLESAATLIRTYEGQFIPGLLQTDDYMRAVVHGAHLESAEEVGRRVRLRMARQTLLTQEHPPRLWAVVDEAALRRPVGGREVMRGQLERLIDATKLPNVTLQILPFGAGAWCVTTRA